MKIIKKFNDGTALVQRDEKQPEIVKLCDITLEDRTSKISLCKLDGDGFVIDGSAYNVSITENSVLFVKVESDGVQYTGSIKCDEVLKLLDGIKNVVIHPATIVSPK